jgi:hypothetical protein
VKLTTNTHFEAVKVVTPQEAVTYVVLQRANRRYGRGMTMAKKEQINWNSFTKAELIKTIRTLHTRQTKLLNRIAELEAQVGKYDLPDISKLEQPRDAGSTAVQGPASHMVGAAQRYPWETQLANTVTYEPTNGKPNCRKENE